MLAATTITAIATAIATAWAALLGTAYLARFRLGLSRPAATIAVVATYAILAALALAWFGLNANGALAAFGLLLPSAAAIGLILLPNRRRLSHPPGPVTPP